MNALIRLAGLVVVCGLVSGCKDKPVETAATDAPPIKKNQPTFAYPAQDLTAAIVEVNGSRLTLGDALQETEIRLGGMRQQIPPDRIEEARLRIFDSVVEQFVVRTLLLDEAEKQAIGATADDEVIAYSQISSNLPAGVTLNDVLQKSPMGETRMREEVRIGITIQKLMAVAGSNVPAVAAAEVDQFITENAEDLQMPETVHARHILIATAASDSEDSRAEKKTKAESLRRQLKDGMDFATLAAEHSDCPSKQRGGDLGTFPRGRMVKPFEDAAFALATNAYSDVVETPFGYHVIQALAHEVGGVPPRDKVEEMLNQRKRMQHMQQWVGELRTKATIAYGAYEGWTPPSARAPAAPRP